ncbi:MAG: alpha/beta hydrolase family protein, partial [Gemmatimonadaceae bacterium]
MRLRIAAVVLTVLPTIALAQAKPTVTRADYGKWETLAAAALSPNGQWIAFGLNRPSNEEVVLVVTTTANGGRADTVEHATGAVFGNDSRYVAYTIGVSRAERERMTRERRQVRNSAGVRNLTTGAADVFKDIASFAFSKDGRHFAMKRYPAEGKRASDVIVRNLATGAMLTLGNVAQLSWADGPPLLAMTVESEATGNNSVQVYDAGTETLRSLDGSSSLYRMLAWREKSADLAVLRTRVDRGFRDTAHVVLAWTGLSTRVSTASRLDSAPATMRVAEHRRPDWSKDGSVIFLGLRPRVAGGDTSRAVTLAGNGSNGTSRPNGGDSARREPRAQSAEPVSDVQVWHAKDVRLMQQQKVQETQDLQRTLLAAWNLQVPRCARNDQGCRPDQREGSAVVQIGTDLEETTTILEGGRHATETDANPYAFGAMFGRPYRDVYVIDVRTGERRKALEKVRFTPGRSATGRKSLTFDGKDYWSTDLVTGTRVNLSRMTATAFVNKDYDTPTDMIPAYGVAGWTKDDAAVIAYDEFDLWLLPADGSAGRRLTDGRRDSVIFRQIALGSDRTPGIDLTKPIYLATSGKISKQTGYARLMPGKSVERLVLEDARFTNLRRADSADVYAFTRERFDDSPDIFIAGPDLRGARQRTTTNPQQANFAWGKSELVAFKSATGRDLQGVLYYPANYDPSKKYPMIVYTYELLSQELHNYVGPSWSYYNRAVWTQNGYFVLTPDIVFKAREPGVSTLDAVVPAVRSIVARGLVDSTRVGHVGHSWGGYEAAFLPTRTRIFAASVAGAAITNMLSFMGELHWGPGIAELSHWETGQARMEVPFWEDMDAYVRNSPVAKVHELKSP